MLGLLDMELDCCVCEVEGVFLTEYTETKVHIIQADGRMPIFSHNMNKSFTANLQQEVIARVLKLI
jgi:hypothetical protein